MLSRICYAMRMCWKYRAQLRKYVTDPALQLPTIHDLNKNDLPALGLKALIIDYDGVMAAHGALQPRADVVQWLQKFAEYPMFVLSNKPLPERLAYFQSNFPHMHFVIAPRKKPYPDGVQEIIRLSNLEPQQILLLDDRLATGIVVAIDTGVQARWITRPYIDLVQRPVQETWFIMLRTLERLACKLI